MLLTEQSNQLFDVCPAGMYARLLQLMKVVAQMNCHLNTPTKWHFAVTILSSYTTVVQYRRQRYSELVLVWQTVQEAHIHLLEWECLDGSALGVIHASSKGYWKVIAFIPQGENLMRKSRGVKVKHVQSKNQPYLVGKR